MSMQVKHNAAAHRFELFDATGQQAGYASYKDTAAATEGVELAEGSPTRNFDHTYIDPAFRGQGASKILIATAVQESRAAGYRIVASCSAVQHWLTQHGTQD